MDLQAIGIGIDAAFLGALSAGVVLVTEVIKKSGKVPDGWGLGIAALLSAIGVGLLASELHLFKPLTLFIAFAQVLAQAAGAWGILQKGANTDALTSARAQTLLVCGLLGLTMACGGARAGAARQTAVRADTAIYTTLAGYQDVQDSLYKAGQIPDAAYKDLNAKLVVALRTGQQINRTIRAWEPNTEAPPELKALIAELNALSEAVVKSLPDGNVKSQLQSRLLLVQQVVLALFTGLTTQPVAGGMDGPESNPGVGAGRHHARADWAWDVRRHQGSVLSA